MDLTITDEQAWKGSQSLYVTRLGEVANGLGRPRRFRTTMRRDSYDDQSYARVELWTPNGWVEVVSLAGMHPVIAELPSYAVPEGERRDAAYDAMRMVALMLETQAEEVTR